LACMTDPLIYWFLGSGSGTSYDARGVLSRALARLSPRHFQL
jgi:hypothetical protein